MKKELLLILLALIPSFAFTQIQKFEGTVKPDSAVLKLLTVMVKYLTLEMWLCVMPSGKNLYRQPISITVLMARPSAFRG